MVEAARRICPVETAMVIDGRQVSAPGIIRPASDPLLRETWPEAIYLRHFHSTLNYTIETPSGLPLEQRIATHCAALRGALGEFLS
jgi:murein peptide amidase A